MKRGEYYERAFLNRPGFHSIAFVLAYVKRETYGMNTELTIGDCSRNISLSLDVYGQENFDNTVEKLDTLIRVLKRMRAAIVRAGVQQ